MRARKGAEAAYATLRTRVKPLDTYRYTHTDIESARELLRNGSLVTAVERRRERWGREWVIDR